MLRTFTSRNQIINSGLKKVLRSNVKRCIGTEVLKRNTQDKLLALPRGVIAPSQWSTQLRHYSSLPEHFKVNLPALSPTMDSGTIVRWEKKEGDKISEGDILCEIETDKAVMGFETPEEGYLAKILIPEGSKGVPVGNLLCIIVSNQADVAAFKSFKDDGSSAIPRAAAATDAAAAAQPAAPAAAHAAPAPAARAAPAAPAAAAPAHGRVLASPFARRLAELKNIRLGGQGSGLYGSLKSGDLAGQPQAAPAAPAAPAPAPGASYVDIPLTGMRETIAKRLTHAKSTIPHYQLSMTVNVDKLLEFRKTVNEKLAKEGVTIKVSVNDFIVKAIAGASRRHPTVNSHWMDSFIRQFSSVDVSVAVATPTGLITPIVFGADAVGVVEISRRVKELAGKAKEGRLAPHEYQGGTVTVSNLGMFGITAFNAIINPPQSLILACGGIQKMLVEDPNESKGFRTGSFMTVTASCDHRTVDGAVGAEWMRVLRDNLEDPRNMIL